MCKHSRYWQSYRRSYRCSYQRCVALLSAALVLVAAHLSVAAHAEPAPAQATLVPVTIHIKNNRSAGATVYLAVYTADDEKAGWRQQYYQALKAALPQEPEMTLRLELEQGRYAFRAFADVNGNGELDTRRFNRPTEPFAISVAPGRDKPSIRFSTALVPINGDNTAVALTLIYPDELADDVNEESE